MWIKNPSRRIFVFLLLLFLLLSGVLPTALTSSPASALTPGADTLSTLRQAVIPSRDPVDLGRRFLGVTAPTSVPAKAYRVGDVEQFIAENNDRGTSFTVSAQLWYATPHLYMWFQSGFKPDLEAVRASANRFEQRIYPTVHKYFGKESSPGIDNDEHLYILHVRGLGGSIVGYFGAGSEYPRAVMPSSNEHQIFFVNLDNVEDDIGSRYYEAVLAHEFQHMVHANVDANEDGWLNEGLSVLSELLNGFPDAAFPAAFLRAPETQLNTWAVHGDTSANYGAAYLFVTYFWQRFGDNALRMLIQDPSNGLESVANTLRKINATDPETGKPVTVEDLFADWTIANLLNNTKVGDGRFAYPRIPHRLPTARTMKALVASNNDFQQLPVSQFGTAYLSLSGEGKYELTLQCSPTTKITPVDAHSGQMMWWSNKADHSNMRLTRAFDLTSISAPARATLSFWLWHAIEEDWDYGYVGVSTNDGKTWKTLATEDSVPPGGHNNAYGPAYTGYSGTSGNRAINAVWRKQTADLSAYVGKKILLRFEYVTDDATTEVGMLIDDISIPEIGYSTDVESGADGWQAEGWVRIDNVLPQRYLVQMVEFGPTPRVFRLLSPDGAVEGKWMLEIKDNISRLVVGVSGLTEFTTEKAACQYRIVPK
jgi:hypothetical protein